MTILVTGSAGHLGEAVMRIFAAQGVPAEGIDIKESAFTTRVGSILDRAFMDEVVKGASAIIHAATLHKPHVATHDKSAFIATNVEGTLCVLEAAVAHGVGSVVFSSTTSAFGDANRPSPDRPAAWIDETVTPIPRNIYGVTKVAGEDLCHLFARKHGLNVLVLRFSRFFPESDDNRSVRTTYAGPNAKLNELTYRRVELEDAAEAAILAAERAPAIGFDRYIISATTPFRREDVADLRSNAPAVLAKRVPGMEDAYGRLGYTMFPSLDRVYDNAKARQELGWAPRYDFKAALKGVEDGGTFGSALAASVGEKGYHDVVFEDGPFPVD
ncbi:MAG: NAD(P)-dependent oxidoreductase [Pseudomonadota bacterium]